MPFIHFELELESITRNRDVWRRLVTKFERENGSIYIGALRRYRFISQHMPVMSETKEYLARGAQRGKFAAEWSDLAAGRADEPYRMME